MPRRGDRHHHRRGEGSLNPFRTKLLAAAGIALLLLAAAASAIAANVALLGYTDHRNDPIGRLSPRAILATLPPETGKTAPAPTRAPLPAANRHDTEDD